MSTISTTIAQGITLGTSGAYTSPLTISTLGYINNTGSGDAISGPNTQSWTVINDGRIANTGNLSRYGIYLRDGGTVSNTGTINAVAGGIHVGRGPGAVANSGTITATGTNSLAIDLAEGGSVSNAASGLIRAAFGINIGALSSTVTNYGTIDAFGTLISDTPAAVFLGAGGTVINGSGALIQGVSGVGIFLTGSVSNAGTILGGIGISGGNISNTSGLIEGYYGVFVGGPTTLFNAGTIVGTVKGGAGLYSGVAINTSTGSIIGDTSGLRVGRDATVTNSGTILGNTRGINLYGNGSVYNGPNGVISGPTGVYITAANGPIATVNNVGTISTTGTGGTGIRIQQLDGGTVFNDGTIEAFGTGGIGIAISSHGVVIDAGTISGSTAVAFGGTYGNLLVLEHGYKLIGAVRGSPTAGATNVVGLAGSVGSSVIVDYNNLSLANFEDIQFGDDGYNTLKVSDTLGTLPVTISGFVLSSDVIDLTAIGTNGTITQNDTFGRRITVSGSGGTVAFKLDPTDAALFSTASDGVNGTDLRVACFRRGTRILAVSGEVAVEDLEIGDRVVTLSGVLRPIKWIGRRAYDSQFIAGNRAVLPICITAHGLEDRLPARDLWISPEHALFIDGVLVAGRLLVNGTSIVQLDRVEELEYFHLELETHDIIFAEGVPAETYIECDNRGMFQNAAEFAELYSLRNKSTDAFCATRLEASSPELAIILAQISQRHAARKAA